MPAVPVASYLGVTADPPNWVGILFWLGVLVMFVRGARAAERRRRVENQPHTTRDTALLWLAGTVVVGLLLCAMFFETLHPVIESRIGIFLIIVGVGGSLTYLFNRSAKPKAQ